MRCRYKGYYIGGRFRHAKEEREFSSRNPARPHEIILDVKEYPQLVPEAFNAAAAAFPEWRRLSFTAREKHLRSLKREIARNREEIAEAITLEMGKSSDEAASELAVTLAKFDVTIPHAKEHLKNVLDFATDRGRARYTYEPLGPVLLIGPFNFPVHLPNGHWVPALLAGNTVVFKPSEITPLVGQLLAEAFDAAGFPAGVVNVIQGGSDVAKKAVADPQLRGVFFTGSYQTGVAIRKALAARTEVLLALELGGNNPVVVCADADTDHAVEEICKGVFLTSGQRCSATRRLFVDAKIYDRITAALAERFRQELLPPVATESAYKNFGRLRRALHRNGLNILAEGRTSNEGESKNADGYFVPPLFVETEKSHRNSDLLRREWFLPVLFVEKFSSFGDAIEGANATEYGLTASIFTKRRSNYLRFRDEVEAGVINWNLTTVGASGKLPFGGWKHSGNHRPAGLSAIEYCVQPVSSLERSP